MDGKKAAVNACAWLIRRRAKIKALHQSMQGKRKAPPRWRGVIVASELDFTAFSCPFRLILF